MKNYYSCILEVEIDEGCMPIASDLPLRLAIEMAVESLHESAEILHNWSGWGLSKEGAEAVLTETCKDENSISEEDANKRNRRMK